MPSIEFTDTGRTLTLILAGIRYSLFPASQAPCILIPTTISSSLLITDLQPTLPTTRTPAQTPDLIQRPYRDHHFPKVLPHQISDEIVLKII